MSDQLEEYQKLWQSQPIDTIGTLDMIKKLNQIESKNRLEMIILYVSFPLTVGLLYFLMPLRGQLVYQVGFGIITMAMLLMLILFHRNRYGKSVEILEDNRAFLTNQANKLKARIRIASVYMRIYTAAIIIAINVVYFAAFDGMHTGYRLAIHVGISVVLLVFQEYMIRRKLRKYETEYVPLIDHLERMQDMGRKAKSPKLK